MSPERQVTCPNCGYVGVGTSAPTRDKALGCLTLVFGGAGRIELWRDIFGRKYCPRCGNSKTIFVKTDRA